MTHFFQPWFQLVVHQDGFCGSAGQRHWRHGQRVCNIDRGRSFSGAHCLFAGIARASMARTNMDQNCLACSVSSQKRFDTGDVANFEVASTSRTPADLGRAESCQTWPGTCDWHLKTRSLSHLSNRDPAKRCPSGATVCSERVTISRSNARMEPSHPRLHGDELEVFSVPVSKVLTHLLGA